MTSFQAQAFDIAHNGGSGMPQGWSGLNVKQESTKLVDFGRAEHP